jgi:hypothetical protein
LNASFNLDRDSAKEPINKLVLCIIEDAIKLGADVILLELDLELHLKAQKQYEAIDKKYRRPSFSEAISQKRIADYFRFWRANFRRLNIERRFFEISKLPTGLRVIFIVNGVQETMPSTCGELYEDIIRILQVAAGISPKTKGEVSGVIETIKPISKWMFESKDLTQRIQLRRIRANQTMPN